MVVVRLVLMVLAVVCFFLAAIGVVSPRVNLIAAGLCLWLIAVIIAAT